jgi:hypothetical protein
MERNELEQVVAIHQPNFFPWLGYFDKISRSDVFIFLDDVDYPKSSKSMGSWVNRVKLRIADEARWFGCPLQRFDGARSILDVEINDSSNWRRKAIKTIQINYASAKNFNEIFPQITNLIEFESSNLAEYNINAIKHFCKLVGVTTNMIRQSEIGASGRSTDLLVNLVQSAGGTTYLSGDGATGYQNEKRYKEIGVKLAFQNFVPTPYGDTSEFLPGLSIIDFLMHADDIEKGRFGSK